MCVDFIVLCFYLDLHCQVHSNMGAGGLGGELSRAVLAERKRERNRWMGPIWLGVGWCQFEGSANRISSSFLLKNFQKLLILVLQIQWCDTLLHFRKLFRWSNSSTFFKYIFYYKEKAKLLKFKFWFKILRNWPSWIHEYWLIVETRNPSIPGNREVSVPLFDSR